LSAEAHIALAVVTRDRAELLARHLLPCLREVLDELVDVLVVDQSSGDGTARLVEGLSGIRYMRSDPGLSRGRNAAVNATSAPFILFTDDDVSFPVGWPRAVAEAFEGVPEVGAVCGRATDARGRLLPGRRQGIYSFPEIPFALGSGFNFAFRREALEAVGPFDEQFGASARYRAAEDSDMLYRVLRAGWVVRCSDRITVVHHDWRGPEDRLRGFHDYGFGAGAQTVKHARSGDRTAIALAAQEVGRHLITIARSLLLLRPGVAREQVAWLRGLAAGVRRARKEITARPDAGGAAHA
jgi:GT2 family glycosyltransferase